MNRIILIFLFSLALLDSRGQSGPRYIEVVGSAEREVTPNIIVVSVRLQEYEENREKVPLDKIERDFMSAVEKSKIAKENIQLSDLMLNAVRRKREGDVYAQKAYEITFSSAAEVLRLLENLKDVNLDHMDIVKLSHTDMEKYRLETKVEALKAAERKAEALLASIGAKRGRALLVDETPEGAIWQPENAQSNVLHGDIAYKASVGEIHFKKINLRFEILARFEIEN